jgi:hypothetical protein
MSKLRLLASFALAIVALLAVTATSALAARDHIVGRSFGEAGSGKGQLSGPAGLAVNEASGDVYVVDKGNNRVERFSATGTYLGKFDGSGSFEVEGTTNSGEAAPTGAFLEPETIAVDNNASSPSFGDVYVGDAGHRVVDKFDPAGAYLGQLTGTCENPGENPAEPGACPGSFRKAVVPFSGLLGVAVDAVGSLWVYQSESNAEIDSFSDAKENEFLSRRTNPENFAAVPGLAVDSADNLYVENVFGATIKLDNSGNVLSSEFYRHRYGGLLAVDRSSNEVYIAAGGEPGSVARLTPAGSLVEKFGALVAGSGIAINATTGEVFAVDAASAKVDVFVPEPTATPTIDSESASQVSATAAQLETEVNPRGLPTTWHFELDTDPYAKGEGPHGISRPAPDASAGSEFGDLPFNLLVQGLAPGTTYHYRVIAHNALGTVEGPDRQFTTQGTAPFLLLDDRAWEMVSPANKGGGSVAGIDNGPYVPLIEAAANGESITYGSSVAFAEPVGSPPGDQYLATRAAGGWSTRNIGIPVSARNYSDEADPPYKSFSDDLSAGLVSNGALAEGALPPPIPGTDVAPGRGNFYLRDSATQNFRALLTNANLEEAVHPRLPLHFAVATPDLRHIVVKDDTGVFSTQFEDNLYEWTEGHWALLNLLPGQTQPAPGAEVGAGLNLTEPHALSADGSRLVWREATGAGLFLRLNIGQEQSALSGETCTEPTKACTLQIDASEGGPDAGGEGHFLTASTDGSKIYFADQQKLTPDSTATAAGLGDLYRFEPDAPQGHRLTDLTVAQNPAESAALLGVLGASEDGSRLYFVADGVLAQNEGADGSHASPGNCKPGEQTNPLNATCNLYLSTDGRITFIATLAGADNEGSAEEDHGIEPVDWVGGVTARTVRLSSDGRTLVFVSTRSLTGYDNTSVNGTFCGKTGYGLPRPPACAETFLYQAPTSAAPAGHISCLSCNPTGARPSGPSGIPGATKFFIFEGLYDSRALSADADRVFFDSADALVPQDTNGKLDVYEWEALEHGTCTESTPSFTTASGGCVDLISSGTSPENSEFADASANGSDVFFITGASLVARDPGSVDLYDARVAGGEAEESASASCSGDACQTPSPPPNDPTPGSLTFQGAGNIVECPNGGSVQSSGKCISQKAKKHKQKIKKHKQKAKGPKHHKQSKKRHAKTNRRAGK